MSKKSEEDKSTRKSRKHILTKEEIEKLLAEGAELRKKFEKDYPTIRVHPNELNFIVD